MERDYPKIKSTLLNLCNNNDTLIKAIEPLLSYINTKLGKQKEEEDVIITTIETPKQTVVLLPHKERKKQLELFYPYWVTSQLLGKYFKKYLYSDYINELLGSKDMFSCDEKFTTFNAAFKTNMVHVLTKLITMENLPKTEEFKKLVGQGVFENVRDELDLSLNDRFSTADKNKRVIQNYLKTNVLPQYTNLPIIIMDELLRTEILELLNPQKKTVKPTLSKRQEVIVPEEEIIPEKRSPSPKRFKEKESSPTRIYPQQQQQEQDIIVVEPNTNEAIKELEQRIKVTQEGINTLISTKKKHLKVMSIYEGDNDADAKDLYKATQKKYEQSLNTIITEQKELEQLNQQLQELKTPKSIYSIIHKDLKTAYPKAKNMFISDDEMQIEKMNTFINEIQDDKTILKTILNVKTEELKEEFPKDGKNRINVEEQTRDAVIQYIQSENPLIKVFIILNIEIKDLWTKLQRFKSAKNDTLYYTSFPIPNEKSTQIAKGIYRTSIARVIDLTNCRICGQIPQTLWKCCDDTTLYCGVNCQVIDWEDNHKQICQRKLY